MYKNIIITPDATLAPAGEAMPLRQGGTVTGTEARRAVFARRPQRRFFAALLKPIPPPISPSPPIWGDSDMEGWASSGNPSKHPLSLGYKAQTIGLGIANDRFRHCK